MAYPVLIIGKSGSGKSASLRNLNPADVAIINVLGKPLPFKAAGFRTYKTDDYDKVKSAIAKTKAPIVVIDDAGYLITNAFMRGHASGGSGNSLFAFYNTIGDQFWGLIQFISALNTDQRIYIIMHEDVNDFGAVKPKTIGKLLDEKVNVEGMFTICLRCMIENGQHVFRTQSDGNDVAKTPIGMFDTLTIDNDLALVDKSICEYYEIKSEGDKS